MVLKNDNGNASGYFRFHERVTAMDMTGEYLVPAPQQAVWEALNDPEVLKQCIPGCDEVNKTSDTSFDAKVSSRLAR